MDEFRAPANGAVTWQSATTIDEFGELTAQWLEGRMGPPPGYGGERPDPETNELVPTLATMNRSGFWTDNSQPGETDGQWVQRASVSGYCTEATCNAILAATVDTELIVLAIPATLDSWVQIPVSRLGAVENTWAGAHSAVTEHANFLSAAGVYAIQDAWYIEVIDPVWGRNDLLWDVVATGLRDRPQREIRNHGQFGDQPPTLPNCRLVD